MEGISDYLHIQNQPRNSKGPLFDEPWQLTAFGIVVGLHQMGYFDWSEWVEHLSAEISLRRDYGVADHNRVYYHQWLAALEKLVVNKKLLSVDELLSRKEEWRHADEHREFGQPVSLAEHHHEHDAGHHHHGLGVPGAE